MHFLVNISDTTKKIVIALPLNGWLLTVRRSPDGIPIAAISRPRAAAGLWPLCRYVPAGCMRQGRRWELQIRFIILYLVHIS